MRRAKWLRYSVLLVVLPVTLMTAQMVRSAYHHEGEKDAAIFLTAYPDKAGTKLDSCNLCHSGGSYVQSGKTVTMGSCQWCHYKYGYDASGDINETLNAYGKAYRGAGRSTAALITIEKDDSDGDGYTNKVEIAANRYPGDATDDPNKVPAPYRVYTRKELEKMPQHKQFMLMNTTKSGDSYLEYSGVTLETLLKKIMLPSITGVKVFSPDGFSVYHPLNPDSNVLSCIRRLSGGCFLL